MPLKILHHKSFHVYNAENIARVQRDEARARLEEEEKDRRIGLADSEARLDRMRASTSLVRPSASEYGGNSKKRKRREEVEAEKRLERHLRGGRRDDDDDDRNDGKGKGVSRAGNDVSDGHLNFWAEFERDGKPTSAEHPERKLERTLEQQKLDDLTKVYLAKKGEGDVRGWYASEDGKTEKERKETDEARLERAYKDGENKRLTDPLALMHSFLRRRAEVLNSLSTSQNRTPATPDTQRGGLSPVITSLLAPRRRGPVPARPTPPSSLGAPPSASQSKLSTTSTSRPFDPEVEAQSRVSAERARAAALIAARKRSLQSDGASSVASTPRTEFGAQGYGMFNRQETRDAKESWNGVRIDGDRRRPWSDQKRRRDEREGRGTARRRRVNDLTLRDHQR